MFLQAPSSRAYTTLSPGVDRHALQVLCAAYPDARIRRFAKAAKAFAPDRPAHKARRPPRCLDRRIPGRAHPEGELCDDEVACPRQAPVAFPRLDPRERRRSRSASRSPASPRWPASPPRARLDLQIPPINTTYTIFGTQVSGSRSCTAASRICVLGALFGLVAVHGRQEAAGAQVDARRLEHHLRDLQDLPDPAGPPADRARGLHRRAASSTTSASLQQQPDRRRSG